MHCFLCLNASRLLYSYVYGAHPLAEFWYDSARICETLLIRISCPSFCFRLPKVDFIEEVSFRWYRLNLIHILQYA